MTNTRTANTTLRVQVTIHREGCLHITFRCADRDVFNEAVESLKRNIPPNMRSYKEGTWNIRPEQRPTLKMVLESWQAWFAAEVTVDDQTEEVKL
jgi:hypothetical protein